MRKFVGANMKGEVWESFKKYVNQKHGKIHTVLGQELEKAIKEYISKHKEGSNLSIRAGGERNNNLDNILMRGRKNGYYKEISNSALAQIIKKERGIIEDRQAEKWINSMIQENYIKPVNSYSSNHSIYQILR